MKRMTKKERERRKAEGAAARKQLSKWISTKAEVSLIFTGPFFAAGMEGHLEQSSKDPDALDFFGSQTSFRVAISLARCVLLSAIRPDSRGFVWLQGPTKDALVLCDPDRDKSDAAELLKHSGGRPN
jgi:hypothetical protein